MGLCDSYNSKESQKDYNKTNRDYLDFHPNCNCCAKIIPPPPGVYEICKPPVLQISYPPGV